MSLSKLYYNFVRRPPDWAVDLRNHITRLENEMALDFTKVNAAVTRQQGVVNSVLQVLTDLRAAIADLSSKLATAIAANDPAAQAAVQAQLDALATGIDSNDDAIAAAVAAPGSANTPAPAPTPGAVTP